MKNDIADILFKYTTGEATLEETNDALKEAEAGFNLEPGRNEITPDEMALTTVGDTPEEANGFGLLDTAPAAWRKSMSPTASWTRRSIRSTMTARPICWPSSSSAPIVTRSRATP